MKCNKCLVEYEITSKSKQCIMFCPYCGKGIEYSDKSVEYFEPESITTINSHSNHIISGYNELNIEVSIELLEELFRSNKIDAKIMDVKIGTTFTRYEVQIGQDVKMSRIMKLEDEITSMFGVPIIRFEIPVPGKTTIGIEIPNKDLKPVYLRDELKSDKLLKHSSKLAFVLGKDISNQLIIGDISRLPHLLIAGSTGSGKSTLINSLIISILSRATSNEVKFIMIDPKVVELGIYNDIPHMLIPVITDPFKAVNTLSWVVQEMVDRYKLFSDKGVRDIDGYNKSIKETDNGDKLHIIVIIVDELADLMAVSANEVEDAVCRLAQMARATGIHLIMATQRPAVNVITGMIKANIPSRIAFKVASAKDSRTILDEKGAEKLQGKGDMLFYPVGDSNPTRIQGAFISDNEIEAIVSEINNGVKPKYDKNIMRQIDKQ